MLLNLKWWKNKGTDDPEPTLLDSLPDERWTLEDGLLRDKGVPTIVDVLDIMLVSFLFSSKSCGISEEALAQSDRP